MINVPTTLTVVNDVDVRGQAMVALIKQYIGIQGYYGFRSIGASEPSITLPCFMVDPKGERDKMVKLGKYRKQWDYSIYFYVSESSPDAIVTLASFVGEALVKLFSNNALGDLNGANTAKFKQYPNPGGGYYWLNSEMTTLDWSSTFLSGAQQGQKYMRAGIMRLTIEDDVIA